MMEEVLCDVADVVALRGGEVRRVGGIECLLHVLLEQKQGVAELLLGLLLRHGDEAGERLEL